jgi:hypothetical protein
MPAGSSLQARGAVTGTAGFGKGYGAAIPSATRTPMSAAKTPSVTHGKHPEERVRPRGIPIEKLGWTRQMALEARQRVASLLGDWEDPSMDVYDEEP